MIDFSRPVRFRGSHAAYAQFLCKERGKDREGGANIFNRVMDVYMVGIIVGLKYGRASVANEDVLLYKDIFGKNKEKGNEKITSSDINAETVHSEQEHLNYLYRLVMLCENERKLSDDEKIANAFKSEGNEQKIEENIELMNKFARGGVEILYERFSQANDSEILRLQEELAFFDEFSTDSNLAEMF